jgi:uncharacterized protein YjiS (DUF1127 family)
VVKAQASRLASAALLGPALAMEKKMAVSSFNVRSGPAGEWAGRFSAFLNRVMSYWARRETIKMLRQLDDHQLRDIGLPRHRIESEVKRRKDSGAALFG